MWNYPFYTFSYVISLPRNYPHNRRPMFDIVWHIFSDLKRLINILPHFLIYRQYLMIKVPVVFLIHYHCMLAAEFDIGKLSVQLRPRVFHADAAGDS